MRHGLTGIDLVSHRWWGNWWGKFCAEHPPSAGGVVRLVCPASIWKQYQTRGSNMPQLKYTVRESQGFEVWPKGSYNMRIVKAGSGTSKQNNPQLVLDLECIDGPYEGKKKKWWITFTEKSGFDLPPLLEAAIPGQYEAIQADPDAEGNKRVECTFDPDDLVDKIITVDMTEYKDSNGTDQNRMKARAFAPEGLPAEGATGAAVQHDAQPQERQATERRRASA